ncbi:hypothetical protein ACDY96_25110 [Rhizobium mongolense]|uniref:hypothetical protein n=1 Tax=Rhizobium mongolense TaxID=57676 RepID=UPI0035574778
MAPDGGVDRGHSIHPSALKGIEPMIQRYQAAVELFVAELLKIAQQQEHLVKFGFDVTELFDLYEFLVVGQHEKSFQNHIRVPAQLN